jgi:hypothetical protein
MFRISPSLLRTAATFILSFGLAKGTAFVAALALPRLVDTQTYGILELAMTIGAFSAALLGLSAHTAAARIHLVEKHPQARTILIGHCFWLATIGLVAAGGMVAAGRGADYVVCTAILGLFALQMSASTYTRMHGLIHLSGWFDSTSILVTTAVAIVLLTWGAATPAGFAWAFAAITAVVGGTSALALGSMPGRDVKALIMRVVHIGGPMTLYGFLTVAIFGTSRIAIAKALTISDVASFSLCARLALILVFLHQVMSTGFFRQLYQMNNGLVGRVLAGWIVVLSAIALALAVVTHFLAPWLVIGTQVPAAAIVPIFPAIIVQTVLWILNANLDLYINRELIARQASLLLAGLTLAAAGVGLLLYHTGQLSLPAVINVYTALMLATLIGQMMLLSRKGFSFKACYAVLPLAATPMLVSLLP